MNGLPEDCLLMELPLMELPLMDSPRTESLLMESSGIASPQRCNGSPMPSWESLFTGVFTRWKGHRKVGVFIADKPPIHIICRS